MYTLAEKSNPLANGSNFNLRTLIEDIGERTLGEQFKKKRSLISTISAITEVPYIKSLISTNPILSTVNNVISSVSSFVGGGSRDFKPDGFNEFTGELGDYISYFEKLAVINSNYASQIDSIKIRFEELNPQLTLVHKKIVHNVAPDQFDSEEAVLDYDPNIFNTNYSSTVSFATAISDISIITARLFGKSESDKKFRKAIALSTVALELAAKADSIKTDLDKATKYAKAQLDKLIMTTEAKPEIATKLKVKQTNEILKKEFASLYVNNDPAGALKILQPITA